MIFYLSFLPFCRGWEEEESISCVWVFRQPASQPVSLSVLWEEEWWVGGLDERMRSRSAGRQRSTQSKRGGWEGEKRATYKEKE